MSESEELPAADGPLVRLALPDGQRLYAVVRRRRRERDGSWWYDLQVQLASQAEERGRLVAQPSSVDLRVPAGHCTPVPGQDYADVPTERHGVVPRWRIEEPVYFGAERGPSRLVHRGDCRAVRDVSRPVSTDQAREALGDAAAAPCPVCRPDRPLMAR
ncbi:DUF6233 domain-containing protein [Actinacidiphila yeochonensis]|uniref:DUF6233 domain-containing protein n=1 Tax=Actinacidiphila yeochonensis TaxID=89050 RepID=UPI00068D1B10|nr:DUF6233 domain-containing protein [Actinacidiphila yeochonensis]